ncbi:hypothetical protein TeGR_g4015 [Tetraparma gracilis]|uniref:Dynamin N-terminal domain-containing protein n=1 Tax=Tetraparma gracilis TaxID=2962635 RepID=A0ABQ6MSJ5_9STRA|nr:hypothetical protein TeGR_g4015 [Tetraparma gracilis]
MTPPQLSLRAQSLALLSAASSLHRSALPSARLPSEPVSSLSAFLTAGSGGEASAFSAVVAGEFNAGKSTFINALLGAPVLASGPLPTTDSLCLISTAPDPSAPAGPRFDPPAFSKRQHPRNVDVVHYELSHVYGEAASGEASLLSAVTLVDTPGTNAVAELRHDALTKRLLPAADVVLFVTSCERPLSQSERELLETVEGWGKKTLVLLNKSDVLEGGQVEQVRNFVQDKVGEIFTNSKVEVLAVSAKQALAAKVAASKEALPADAGVGARQFLASGFPELEARLRDVLSEDNRVTHKLLSPVGLADSVLGEAGGALEGKREVLRGDIATLDLLAAQFESWKGDVGNEPGKARAACGELFRDAVAEQAAHILKSVRLADYLYGDKVEGSEEHPISRLHEKLVEATLVPPLRGLARRTGKALANKTKNQSVAVVEFIKKRPLHFDNSIVSSTNAAGLSVSGDDVSGRIWGEVEASNILGRELRQTIADAWEGARGRMLGGIGAAVAGGGGAGYFSLVAAGEGLDDVFVLAGLGASSLVGLGGAGVVARTKASIAAGWARELAGGDGSVEARVGKILEKATSSEVEQLTDLVSMQVLPFSSYINAEAEDVQAKLRECQSLVDENNDIRNKIIDEADSLFNFSGGWRSEKKIV